MTIKELKGAEYRTFLIEKDVISFIMPLNYDKPFTISLNLNEKIFTFDQEIISFKEIDKIVITPCFNKINFKNQKAYKIHVFIKNNSLNFKRYLGLFEYTEDNSLLEKLPLISEENKLEYKSFSNYEKEDIIEEEMNLQYSRINFVNTIINLFKKS